MGRQDESRAPTDSVPQAARVQSPGTRSRARVAGHVPAGRGALIAALLQRRRIAGRRACRGARQSASASADPDPAADHSAAPEADHGRVHRRHPAARSGLRPGRGRRPGDRAAFDFRPMFAQVKPQLSAADLAICHQETALSATDVGLIGYPVFNSPHEIAPAIADAGYDGCSTASNHSYDHGAQGVARHDRRPGRGRTSSTPARRPRQPPATSRRSTPCAGVKIALLDYTYGLNGFVLPAGQPLSGEPDQRPAPSWPTRQGAKLAGAQIVIVQMHWGNEYVATPTPEQRTEATADPGLARTSTRSSAATCTSSSRSRRSAASTSSTASATSCRTSRGSAARSRRRTA